MCLDERGGVDIGGNCEKRLEFGEQLKEQVENNAMKKVKKKKNEE